MPADRPRTPSLLLLLLLGTLALGGALRLVGLERVGLTHAEVYTPNLAMPAWVSAPPPRTGLSDTLLGTLEHDNHPPGYYALMWAWTRVAGTRLAALRLPSALAGIATIAAVFFMARRRDGDAVALTAAALLALHGHQVFWSQQARMWVFLGLLAVLSVGLLQSLLVRWRADAALAYVAVAAAGLWFDYTFWPFFAAQVLWLLLRCAGAARAPRALGLQVCALALAAPVPAFLWVHLVLDRTGYLARSGWLETLGEFLVFQSLVRAPVAPESLGPAASLGVLLLLLLGTLLLVAGIAASPPAPPDPAEPAGADGHGSAPRWLAAAAGAAACLGFAATGRHGAAFATAAAAPAALVALAGAAERTWPRWSPGLVRLRGDGLRRRILEDAATLHGMLPLAALMAAALAVPSVAARTLLFLGPFTLVLVSRGLFARLRGPLPRTVGIALLLAVSAVSVVQYTRVAPHRYDYQALAAVLVPELAPRDVILVNDAWYAQPMHFYLPPDRYRTGDFGAHLRGLAGGPEGAPDRVWVVVLDARDVAAFAAVAPRLAAYRQVRRVSVEGSYALLLEREPG